MLHLSGPTVFRPGPASAPGGGLALRHRGAGLGVLLCTAALAVAGRAAAGEPFILGDAALDGITAGGYSVVADSAADAFATGSDTISDTLTDTNVGSDAGDAYAQAVGAGPEGAVADGSAGVLATDGTDAHLADSAAQAASQDATPAVVVGAAAFGAEDGTVSVEATATGDAPESAATALAIVETTGADSSLSGAATSDALSLDGTPSGASVQIESGGGSAGADLDVETASSGDAYAASAAVTETTLDGSDGPITISSEGDAVGIGDGSEATVSTRQRVGGSARTTRVIVHTNAFSKGEEVLDPIATTAVDPGEVPEGAIVRGGTREVSRVVGRPGEQSIAFARSITVFIMVEPPDMTRRSLAQRPATASRPPSRGLGN